MSPARDENLLAWQWRGYSRGHRDAVNLLIHMVTVPAFIAGTLAVATQVLQARWFGAAVALVVALAALAIQQLGNKREALPPQPFAGTGDLVARVFAEQFITFPRFVLSGQWARNLAGQYD